MRGSTTSTRDPPPQYELVDRDRALTRELATDLELPDRRRSEVEWHVVVLIAIGSGTV